MSRPDSYYKLELEAIQAAIRAANDSAIRFHAKLGQALRHAKPTLDIIDDSENRQAVALDLSTEEVLWVREATLKAQGIQDQVNLLSNGMLKDKPVLKAQLHRMRDSLYNAKHKLLRYIFDGKGAYGQDQSTTYNLCGLFDESEHKDANWFFITLKRATVARG